VGNLLGVDCPQDLVLAQNSALISILANNTLGRLVVNVEFFGGVFDSKLLEVDELN
jgi:hypothetical protein